MALRAIISAYKFGTTSVLRLETYCLHGRWSTDIIAYLHNCSLKQQQFYLDKQKENERFKYINRNKRNNHNDTVISDRVLVSSSSAQCFGVHTMYSLNLMEHFVDITHHLKRELIE